MSLARKSRLRTPMAGVLMAIVASAVLSAGALTGAVDATASAGTAGATIWPGGTWSPEAPTYGVYSETDVPITMDDGVVLRADIDYPADPTTG